MPIPFLDLPTPPEENSQTPTTVGQVLRLRHPLLRRSEGCHDSPEIRRLVEELTESVPEKHSNSGPVGGTGEEAAWDGFGVGWAEKRRDKWVSLIFLSCLRVVACDWVRSFTEGPCARWRKLLFVFFLFFLNPVVRVHFGCWFEV